MRHLVRLILGLYPPWWRKRYGTESQELTEDLLANPEAKKVRILGSLLFGSVTAWTQIKRRAEYLQPVGAGGPSTLPPRYPPNPHDVITASRRGHGRAIAFGVVAGLVCVTLAGVLIYVAIVSFAKGLGKAAFQGLDDATTQGPPAYAQSADSTAKKHHMFDGALTLSLLNQQHLGDVKWFSGSHSVSPFPLGNKGTGWSDVSTNVRSDHVVTAAYVVGCAYGLTVSATDDPIIGEDHLPGVGNLQGVGVVVGNLLSQHRTRFWMATSQSPQDSYLLGRVEVSGAC